MSNRFEEGSANSQHQDPPELTDEVQDASVIDEGVIDEGVTETQPKPKRKRNPLVAIGGAAILAVVGYFGLSTTGGPPPAPADDAPAVAQPQLQPPVAQSAPPDAVAPGVMAPGASAPGALVPLEATAPAVAMQVVAPSLLAPPAAPVDMSRIDSRLDELANQIEVLKAQQRMKQRAASDAPAAAGAVAGVIAVRDGDTAVRSARTSSSSRAKARSDVIEKAPPATLEGLNLRAVYPAAGPDMQAWVMEGDSMRVVSRGSVVGGARVLEVKSGLVVTDRGVIR